MAVKAYSSPGVTVTETVNPSLAPLLANPSIVAIVGAARGFQSASERLVLPEAQTALVGSHALPQATINVTSTAGFDSSGTLEIGSQVTPSAPITVVSYTGKTATSFTGASGGTGTFATGQEVRQQPKTQLKYTGVSSPTFVLKSSTTAETLNAGTYLFEQGTDPDVGVVGDEPYFLSRRTSPEVAPVVVLDTGAGTLTGNYSYAVSFVNASGEIWHWLRFI